MSILPLSFPWETTLELGEILRSIYVRQKRDLDDYLIHFSQLKYEETKADVLNQTWVT